MPDNKDKGDKKLERRDFLKYSGGALGGAFTASALSNLGLGQIVTAEETPENDEDIRPQIPPAVKKRIEAKLPDIDWPLTGAQVFAKACAEEGLAAQFLVPGNYDVTHALADEGIYTIAGRDERSMAHAADGFIRASGEVALCSGTEGPGFTNMITGIASANFARTPMFAVASNMNIHTDDTEASIQDLPQQPLTEGIKKYGKRLINPKRIWEYTAYAFRNLKNGEPGVIHLDFPREITQAEFEGPGEQMRSWGKEEYRAEATPHPSPEHVERAAELINKADQPMLVASTGVFYNEAWEPLRKLAEKADIPVAQSGPTMGHFSNDHDLSACLSYKAYPEADLIIYVGQYCMPPNEEAGFGTEKGHNFSYDSPRIQIEPVAEKIGRNIPVEVGIPSNEKEAMVSLREEVSFNNNRNWVNRIKQSREDFENEIEEIYQEYKDFNEAIHPAVISKELADYIYEGDIPKERTTVVTGGYGINFYARRWMRSYRPGQLIMAPYQFGAIGSAMGMSVGVAAAVKEGAGVQKEYKGAPVVCIASDGGFGISGFEIETMARYKLPVVVVLYNNNAWGTFMSVYDNPVKEHIHLMQKNLRYDELAQAMGANGEYVTSPEEFKSALERSFNVAENESLPSVINCQGIKEFWLKDKYPPGFLGAVQPGIMTLAH